MNTLLFTLGAVTATSFVLGLWFAGQAAVDRRRLKNLWVEHVGLVEYGQKRLQDRRAIHQRDQAEIKALRELIKELIGESVTVGSQLEEQTDQVRKSLHVAEDRLKKIPSDPPTPDCP